MAGWLNGYLRSAQQYNNIALQLRISKAADMEIDVGAYIGDLLFDHNSVNIPGLGGFVARYKPAFSDQVQGELHPPAKGLNFNGNLVVDDGLLAEYIRDKHQLSLGEARQAVDDYVQKVREAIARREIVVFPKVGRLYKDYENNLQFLADGTNFNTDSYGLPIVHFYPVSRAERPAVKPVATPKPPPRPAMKDMRTFFSRLFGNGLAVIIGLAVVVVVVAIYFLLFNRPGKDPEWDHLPLDFRRIVRGRRRGAVGRCHTNVEIGHPDIAILGLLVPHIEHVVGGPEAIRFFQADAFADARNGGEAQPLLRLAFLILDFDFDHDLIPSGAKPASFRACYVARNPCRIPNM